MAARVRVIVRIGLLIPWTLGLFALRLSAIPLDIIAPQAEAAIRRGLFRFWSRGACAIAGIRVEIQGTPPRRPFFIVTNHLTFLDVVVLARELGCVFVSREDVSRWPILGFITRRMNTIYIDRARPSDTVRVNALIAKAMARDGAVHVFPEGRVSPDGRVQPFKPPLLQPAVDHAWPVHCAALTYRTSPGAPPASEAIHWKEHLGFSDCLLNLLRLPSACATLAYGPAPLTDTDRKSLAESLCSAVRDCFTPMDETQ